MIRSIGRRAFARLSAGAATTLAVGAAAPALAAASPYQGRNVVIIRFGGGVRRRETIDPDGTSSPYLRHVLVPRGTLFANMEMSSAEDAVTGHVQGTLYILTGKYDRFEAVEGASGAPHVEAKVPTLFEYLRKAHDVPAHRALVVNGEDRRNDELVAFGRHHMFGAKYRSEVLSLHRFRIHLLRRQIARGGAPEQVWALRRRLSRLEARDPRAGEDGVRETPEIAAFWERWRRFYGETGLVHPRGDRLLTELAVRALRELRPRLLMVNYQDPDYVHWGNMSHYTRAISIIDRGIRRIVAAVEADPEYRDNTVFVVVPDCGRDSNPFMEVPCQHHFGSRSAREVWAIFFGAGIARGVTVGRPVDQISIAATVGRTMGVATPFAEGSVLGEAFA